MQSSFLGIEIGKRSLLAHQKGLSVIGHNLANANTDGYSRQRVTLKTIDPLYAADLTRAETAGQIGQGVEVVAIERVRDSYLDERIYAELGHSSFWKTTHGNLKDVERIHNALEKHNMQERLDEFWQSWQELSKRPHEHAVREELLQNTISLTTDIKDKFRQLNSLRQEINQKVISEASRINAYSKNIAELNQKINASLASGDNPNDLLDKRDMLVEEVSKIVDISTNRKDKDEFMVYIGGEILVQGQKTNLIKIEEDINNESLANIKWAATNEDIVLETGSLHANLLSRDDTIKDQVNRLNVIATNLIYSVNDVHQQGFDHYNNKAGDFFNISETSERADRNLIYQITGDQKLNSDTFIGENGTVSVRNQNGDIVELSYSSNEKISDALSRFNDNNDSVHFYVNQDQNLVIKARSDVNAEDNFALSYFSDSGRFLSGVSGVFNNPNEGYNAEDIATIENLKSGNIQADRTPSRHPASWISVSEKIIKDVNLIAAKGGTDYDNVAGSDVSYGDGENDIALNVANLRYKNNFFDGKENFNEFYVAMIDKIGSTNSMAISQVEKYDIMVNHLQELRSDMSGVNIDEEMANMMAMQHGYKAGAKIIKIMDEMLDTLINRMG